MRGNPQLVLQSNECRVVVHEPQGIDREACDLLQNVGGYIEDIILYDGRGGASESEGKIWQEITSRYASSTYAPYALFSLACAYERGNLLQSKSMKPYERTRQAAHLFEKCARRFAGSPLGAQAYLMAAHNYREAGDLDQWHRTYASMLTCPGMTDQRRLHALAFLFLEERKPPTEDYAIPVPLRPVAESMGFKVTWNPADKTAEVSNARVHITVRPEDASMKDGRMMVPLKDLAPLVAERYGRCRETGEKY